MLFGLNLDGSSLPPLSTVQFLCQFPHKTHVDHFNPLTPKSDWCLISPFDITPESNIKVVRIKEMITNERGL